MISSKISAEAEFPSDLKLNCLLPPATWVTFYKLEVTKSPSVLNLLTAASSSHIEGHNLSSITRKDVTLAVGEMEDLNLQ